MVAGAWLGRGSAGVLLLHGSVCFSPLTGKGEHALDSGVFVQSQSLMRNFQTNNAATCASVKKNQNLKNYWPACSFFQKLFPKEFINQLFNEEFVWFHCIYKSHNAV